MNIKINKEQFERLYQSENIAQSYVFGSQLYGTSSKGSDTDILVVYYPVRVFGSCWNYNSGLPCTHQFQYDDVENNKQFVFTTHSQVYRNLISGDSTINAEVLMFHESFNLTKNEKLARLRTYKIIKAFLGFAKRDLKHSKKGYEAHVARGMYIAEKLIQGELPILSDIQGVINRSQESFRRMFYHELQSQLREKLNNLYDAGEIPLYHIPETDDDLLNLLLQSNNTKEFKY